MEGGNAELGRERARGRERERERVAGRMVRLWSGTKSGKKGTQKVMWCCMQQIADKYIIYIYIYIYIKHIYI